MFRMSDIGNSVIFVLSFLVFAELYRGMLIHALVSGPGSVVRFAVDGQRPQRNCVWCLQIFSLVDLEEAEFFCNLVFGF